jgi:Protein of unknown function (DUF3039)
MPAGPAAHRRWAGRTTYAEGMATITDRDRTVPRASLSPDQSTGATLAPARPDPELDDGDHDRMAHIVLEGYTPKKGRKKGDFISAGPSVVEGIVNGTAVRALCGKEWVPGRNPGRYGLCPTCKEIAESMGWKIPAN